MTTKHGTKAGYNRHRKLGEPACDHCKKAAAAYEATRQVRLARSGPNIVPSAPVVAAIDAAGEAGISLLSITRRANLTHSHVWQAVNGNQHAFYRSTAQRLTQTIREIVTEQQEALARCCDHLDYLEGQPRDVKEWPTAALLAAADRHWAKDGERKEGGTGLATLLNTADRRYLYRSDTLDTSRAERICRALGFLPEDVWLDWWTEGAA